MRHHNRSPQPVSASYSRRDIYRLSLIFPSLFAISYIRYKWQQGLHGKSIYSVKTIKAGLTYTATKYNILLGLFIRYESILLLRKNIDSALSLIQYLAI